MCKVVRDLQQKGKRTILVNNREGTGVTSNEMEQGKIISEFFKEGYVLKSRSRKDQ